VGVCLVGKVYFLVSYRAQQILSQKLLHVLRNHSTNFILYDSTKNSAENTLDKVFCHYIFCIWIWAEEYNYCFDKSTKRKHLGLLYDHLGSDEIFVYKYDLISDYMGYLVLLFFAASEIL